MADTNTLIARYTARAEEARKLATDYKADAERVEALIKSGRFQGAWLEGYEASLATFMANVIKYQREAFELESKLYELRNPAERCPYGRTHSNGQLCSACTDS